MTDQDSETTQFTTEQCRDLIKETSDVLTVVDADGTIQYQSPSSEHVKGWTPDELRGEQFLDYVHPDDRPRVEETFSDLTEKAGRLDSEIEFRFQSKNEGWIWLAVTGSTPGPESKIDGHIITSRNITDRKQYEKELTAERNFLNKIIESLPYPFYVLDVEDYSIVRANSQATVEQGDTCYEVTHGRDQPCDEGTDTAPCPINEVEVDEPATVKHVHRDDRGNDRIYELHAAPITDDSGDIAQIAESNIDITERVEYERQLESQRDNLELLNQIVRHDIRNDIQIILAYAEALSDVVDAEKDYLEKILEASNDAIEITKTARDITDVMLGEGTELSAVSLRSVLNEEIDSAGSNYDQTVVTVDGSIPPVNVRADDMLEAVFRNLLTNAIQHNDKEVPEVTVSGTVADETVRIQIADNGPGVPDNKKETVFNEGETALESDGTGLGLYLVRTLLDRYGGNIRIKDNEPTGSVFVVELLRFDPSE
jgi:PAS domain S-box-containing protein